MASAPFLSTVADLVGDSLSSATQKHRDVGKEKAEELEHPWSSSVQPVVTANPVPHPNPFISRPPSTDNSTVVEEPVVDPEFKLPDLASLVTIILGNGLAQISFFIIVSAASAYAEHLGGTATFSGLTIGIPTAFAGLALLPMARYDKDQYKIPLIVSNTALMIGNVLYALAYRANFLYLILIGRMVSGFGFICFMYSKRYCSDPRIVGIRRRTTLASYLVVGQGFGFSAGPFLGGLLFKIGFPNDVFNGYTSPGWLMAIIWTIFGIVSAIIFKDVRGPRTNGNGSGGRTAGASEAETAIELSQRTSPAVTITDGLGISTVTNRSEPRLPTPPPADTLESEENRPISPRQWGIIFTMMWYAMTCFFVLGAWESNIPVYSASKWNYSPYNAGNFIALGGITTFPFLLVNVWYSRRLQDRVILAIGSSLGMAGILIMLATIATDRVSFGSFYICWSLVALGFNLASTCTLSLLSKQLPPSWNGKISLAIQYSNYTGRVTGAIWGGAGVDVGMLKYLGLQIVIAGVGIVLHMTLWRELKAKTG
ncbi:hypothetical protein AX16_007416 [Volvariella volvacea WC 439]|nr:hypothetical protein AX16_007416 [Volvariella volvacea WC 439]